MVSVIIPCYNASRWIRETLDSVSGQSGVREIIVVDDGSTDDSAAIVHDGFPEVRLIRSPNQGASRARNTGTQAATGQFIQYLDSDDLLAPGKIRTQLDAIKTTGADVAYGDWRKLEGRPGGEFTPGELVAREMRGEPEIELFTDFWCPPAAYLFRRSVVDAVGGWNENLPVIQDARFALDCALRGGRFVYTPGLTAWYRIHGNDSLSRRSPLAFNRDVYRNACEVEAWWREHSGLSEPRKQALIKCFGYVARVTYEKDREGFEQAYGELRRLAGRYVPESPRHLAAVSRIIGYPRAEAVALFYRLAKDALGARRA